MNTELTNYTSLENFEAIAALTGASVSTAVYLPRLKINRNPIDDDGKPIPMGSFSVTQEDKTAYGKIAFFRVFLNRYQYAVYDPKEKKFTNRSIQIKNFFEEAIDELGGVSCGKIPSKELANYPLDVQQEQRKIKCNRILYGTVTIPNAHDADNEKITIENLPVVMRLAGTQFMAPRDILDAITKMKHQYFQHELKLSLSKPQKNGDTIYYNLLLETDFKKLVPFTDQDLETFNLFKDIIDRETNYISKKWTEAKRGMLKEETTEDEMSVLSALDLNDPIDDLLAE